VAGLVARVRVEVLGGLGAHHRGASPELTRWGAAGEWPETLVQGGILAAAASLVLFGTRGPRRMAGALLAALFLLSGLTGWPVEDAPRIPTGVEPGVPGPLELGLLAAGAALLVALLAEGATRSAALMRALRAPLLVAAAAAVGLGLPAWQLGLAADAAPTMPVRTVLAELGSEPGDWRPVGELPHPVRTAVLSPHSDLRLTGAVGDTGDRVTLVLSPPATVEVVLPEGAAGATLRTAAQVAGRYTDRGIDLEGYRRPSILDQKGLESLSVRMRVELDGEVLMDELVTHRNGDDASLRTWRHLGEAGEGVAVRPGQVLRLSTGFGDEATAAAFAGEALDCGFGDLLLERWEELPRTRATPEAPNLLFVTVDTLRADRMSCYGYRKPTTPNLDGLARRGVLHERAFATSSWTWPSTASLLTGLLPYEHGVLSNQACNLAFEYETLAEALQRRGYTTAAISCNPLIDRARRFDQGFEQFDDGPTMRMTDEVIEEVLATLDGLADARFFLYLHLADPHTPHRPLASELERLGGEAPEDYPDRVVAGSEVDGLDHYAGLLMRGEGRDAAGFPHPEEVIPEDHRRWMSDRYDASVGTADHYLGLVLDRLEALGLDERTVVVVTSDHGEELLDHGMLAHGHALWRELVQVPLILAGPGLPEGVRVSTPVSNRHIAPTLARLGGGELAAVREPRDLADPAARTAEVFYQTSKGYWNGHKGLEVWGQRDDRYSLQYAEQGGPWGAPAAPGGEARIFAVESDPRERTNLIGEDRHRVEAGRRIQELRASLEAQRAARRGRAVGVGASGLKALQGIGYVGLEGEEPAPDGDGR
jgi:arylsulfatase A-like enzyme